MKVLLIPKTEQELGLRTAYTLEQGIVSEYRRITVVDFDQKFQQFLNKGGEYKEEDRNLSFFLELASEMLLPQENIFLIVANYDIGDIQNLIGFYQKNNISFLIMVDAGVYNNYINDELKQCFKFVIKDGQLEKKLPDVARQLGDEWSVKKGEGVMT